MAQKVVSAASSGIKKLGSIASAGVQKLASSSSSPAEQPRDTSLLSGDGTREKDFYTPNTRPIDTSLLYGTRKKDFPTVNTKPKAMAKPSKKLSKPSKTMDQEYEDLMADVGKSNPKPKPKKSATSSSNPAIKKASPMQGLRQTAGTQIPPSGIGIQKLRGELESAKK